MSLIGRFQRAALQHFAPANRPPLAPFDDQGYSFSPIVVSAKRVNGKK
jgi:hypothetical protein